MPKCLQGKVLMAFLALFGKIFVYFYPHIICGKSYHFWQHFFLLWQLLAKSGSTVWSGQLHCLQFNISQLFANSGSTFLPLWHLFTKSGSTVGKVNFTVHSSTRLDSLLTVLIRKNAFLALSGNFWQFFCPFLSSNKFWQVLTVTCFDWFGGLDFTVQSSI